MRARNLQQTPAPPRVAMYDSSKTNAETHPLWFSRLTPADEAMLDGDGPCIADQLRVDVAVIGAGMSGLSVAYHLCQAGRSVAVLDKGLIGSGETGRTTAHVSSALDDRYSVLERNHGREGARLAAASHEAAIAEIARIAAEEQIACEFERVPGYLVSVHDGPAAERELGREMLAARRAGLAVELVREPRPEWGRDWPLRLRFEHQAQFQPLAYLAGLARAIRRRGGRIHTNTRVFDVQLGRSEQQLVLTAGQRVFARDVVVATNTPIVDRFTMHSKLAPYRSYVIAMRLERPLSPALLWDTGDPYHYARTTENGTVLIVGGEDHKVGQADEPERAWAQLEVWSRQHFPEACVQSARWSGQIMEPFDGLAFIGKNPGISRHVFIATGDSGNGITHGAIAGMLLSTLILERRSEQPWRHLYDPARKPLRHALPEYVRENANVAVHYAQWLAPGRQPALPAPGSGAVIRRGLTRVALYIASDGSAHECSARCPHLGCVVQWNPAEHSWDCPCHGSRFDPYGHVLSGPALRDLEPLTLDREQRSASSFRSDAMEHDDLIQHLSHELWQTETSASQHCRREAERLGDCPPARALLEAAEHADEVLQRLPMLARDHAITRRPVGLAVGKLFSVIRDGIGDRMLRRERSYRGTLLGLRHGVDLVQLMLEVAMQSSQTELITFFEEWLSRRLPMVDAVARELRWFAERPAVALELAKCMGPASGKHNGAQAAE
jgi:glycine/D-amino acid oxidase-like deaminating enzyme/nitrite reductase/ring-hydroxylating ferredoxin subunit